MTAAIDKRGAMSGQVVIRNGLFSSESADREQQGNWARKDGALERSSGGGNLLQREMIPMRQC